jgi:hypothetical protein
MRSTLLMVILLTLAQPTYKISGRVVVFPGSRLPQTLTLRTYGQGSNGLNLKSVPVNGDGTFAMMV